MNENDHVSLVRIPRKWFNIFVWTFSSLIILNLLAELMFGWSWKDLGETILTRMAVLMTLIVGWFFILSHIVEAIMLGYAKQFRDKVYAQGKQEGREQGREEGREQGREEVREEIVKELQEAQRKGIPLEQVLETYKTKNQNKTNGNDR